MFDDREIDFHSEFTLQLFPQLPESGLATVDPTALAGYSKRFPQVTSWGHVLASLLQQLVKTVPVDFDAEVDIAVRTMCSGDPAALNARLAPKLMCFVLQQMCRVVPGFGLDVFRQVGSLGGGRQMMLSFGS